jgi:GNAT superfamily N-acetyltransferase
MTPGSQIVIRQAVPSDSEAVAVLLGELGYPKTDVFAHAKLQQLAKKENDRVFVAVEEGKTVGFASCHMMPLIHEEYNLCRVTALVVLPAHRRRKIATRLMNTVEQYAEKSGCGRVEITCGQRRQDAHRFYERIGYREVSRRYLKKLG